MIRRLRRLTIAIMVMCMAAADMQRAVPGVTVGKETTYVDGPLDKDGYVDYETALNRALSKGITPDRNAVVLLSTVWGPNPEGSKSLPDYWKTLGIKEPAEKGDYFINRRKFLKEQQQLSDEKLEEIERQADRAKQRPWRSEDFPELAAWLKANEKPLALAAEACRRPDYFYPLISPRVDGHPTGLLNSLLPGVQASRQLADALSIRAMHRLGEKRFDDAWQDLLTCHRLARLIGRGSTAIEALVGIAVEIVASNGDLVYLQYAPLDAAAIQARLAELRRLPPLPPFADKIDLGERLVF